METVTISLPESLKVFVDTEVAAGNYDSASQLIQQLIRQAQQQKEKQALEARLIQALDSGPAVPMTAQDWDEIRREVHQRHAQRNPS